MFGGSGAALGGMAGRGIASLSGMGDYTISKNSLLQLDEGMQVASFGDMNHGVIIMHREFITDITQSIAFTLSSLPINPGLPGSFPWLSQIAPNFDQYQILGMIFHFKSTASDFGTTTNMAMGTCILATDYDSADTNYGNKLEMENAQYSTSCKPSIDCMHAIECDPDITFAPIKYVRTGAVPTNKDIRLYDQGNFQFATTGMPANGGAIGELWVTYKIAFFKPALNNGAQLLTDWYRSATATNTSRWGSSAVRSTNSSLGTSVTNNTLFFPGQLSSPVAYAKIGTAYWITYACLGSSTALSTIAAISGADCTAQLIDQQSADTTTRQWFTAKVIITGPAPQIQITAMTLPGTPTQCTVIVTQIDTDVAPDIP